MMNSIDTYYQAGVKSGNAMKRGDGTGSRFHYNWFIRVKLKERSHFLTRHSRNLILVPSAYQPSGNLAVTLVAEDGELFSVLSVNLPEAAHLLGEWEFFAKTWGENEEIAEDALASGLFFDTGRTSGDIESIYRLPIWGLAGGKNENSGCKGNRSTKYL